MRVNEDLATVPSPTRLGNMAEFEIAYRGLAIAHPKGRTRIELIEGEEHRLLGCVRVSKKGRVTAVPVKGADGADLESLLAAACEIFDGGAIRPGKSCEDVWVVA